MEKYVKEKEVNYSYNILSFLSLYCYDKTMLIKLNLSNFYDKKLKEVKI